MLTELRISNFGVIDQLALEFHPGFTVLTGETGAGKSLLIDALSLLLGARASADQIRAGAQEAHVEAVFSLASDDRLLEELRRDDYVDSGSSHLTIHRVVAASGRNRNYLNANPVSLHLLERLGGTLVDIHGQHDQQSLLAPAVQLDTLDAFGQLRDLRAEHEAAYEIWMGHRRSLAELQREISEQRRHEDYLRYQIGEIDEANPAPGEDEALETERRRLANTQRLRQLAADVYERLYGDEDGILRALGEVKKHLVELSLLDALPEGWMPFFEDATVQLRELAGQVRDYEGRLEDDPERLAHVERRLDVLERLKKKYGGSLAMLLEQAESLRRDVAGLDAAEERLAERARAADEAEHREQALAAQLSQERRRVARDLQRKVAGELAALRMERTRFEVLVEQTADGQRGPSGQDHVQLLLSANPGEPLRPMARVVSGGELSRVMLALKTILAGIDRVPVLIFDEIDAGVGGAVAELMGRRLRGLANHHQVLCVTHWPQVAAQAHRHCLIEKTVREARTLTRVRELKGAEREAEIARMVGGITVTKNVRAAAAEMMGTVRKRNQDEGR
jgi:DNA repair protein RecN (Recombination protein N)